MTFLTDKKLKAELQKENKKKKIQSNNIQISKPITYPTSIAYIEKLLEIGIRDYRKNAINRSLA